MNRVVVERERKYELRDDAKLPRLEEIAGIKDVSDPMRDKLIAVYFDSTDLRLARSGCTLRRREGGPDEGWHLKLPAGTDTRVEHHAPLGDDADGPPAGLVEPLTGILRGAELVPVARISTARQRRQLLDGGGQVLAEVTDDLVNGQPTGRRPTGWREVEVELAEQADAALLDRIESFLLGSGLTRSSSRSKLGRVLEVQPDQPAPLRRGSTAGEAVMAYLHEQVGVLNRQDIGVRTGAPDSVHQLRVATRRIRAALRVFGRIVDRERTRWIEQELRWLGGALGPARDLEMLEERFRDAVDELPEEWVLGGVNTRLTRHFTPARAKADRAAVSALSTGRYLRLRDELDQLLASPPLTARADRRARKELPKQVGRAYRKVARRRQTMIDTPPGQAREEAAHSLRKAAKRLRYGAEGAVPVAGKQANRTRKRAKTLTKILGELQDAVVARPRWRQLGIEAHQAGDNGFTYGLLAGREWARDLEPDITKAWEKLAR
jgi:CHAD domain-containing protein